MAEGAFRMDAAVALPGVRLEVALEIPPGETVALVGPSGAGKTTCLFLAAGLLRPDRGFVACGDEVWCDIARGIDVSPDRRHVGLVFQDYALFPHLGVHENVAYGPRARGRSRGEARRAAGEWLRRLDLEPLADRPVAGLSGGERQRVALARALASGARVLLLDEPFGALDVATRATVRSRLRAALLDAGRPALLVTHDPVDALALGDRLAVLEDGRITQAGTREELLTRPRTSFVADLAGLNLFRARVADGHGLKEAVAGGLVFHVLADDVAGAASVAFAPSEVLLSAERLPGSAQNAFRGTLRELLPLADRVRVVLDVGALLTADVTREAAASLALAPGRVVWASVKATAIRVYP